MYREILRTVRTLLERLSRGRIVGRCLPEEFGGHRLYVSPDASLKLWRQDLGQADPLLLRLATELVHPGATVWDIGANVGLFAFAAAYRAGPSGRILAIEADDWLAGLVRRSAAEASSAYAPVEVIAAAVEERLGLADLCIAERGRAGNHLKSTGGSTQTGGHREIRKVLTVTLDWLLEQVPAPALVKIDVEGAEAQCLRGAKRLLSGVRPTVLCEVSTENNDAVADILHSHNYVLFNSGVAPVDRHPLVTPSWNTLALPAEFTVADAR
jgi:FkbM family methyltransferase